MRSRPLYKPPARTAFGPSEYAQVAQLVEHATENRSVGGSIPPLGTMTFYPPNVGGSIPDPTPQEAPWNAVNNRGRLSYG